MKNFGEPGVTQTFEASQIPLPDNAGHDGYDDQEIDLFLLLRRNPGQAFSEEDFGSLLDAEVPGQRHTDFMDFVGRAATDPIVGDRFYSEPDTDGTLLFWLEDKAAAAAVEPGADTTAETGEEELAAVIPMRDDLVYPPSLYDPIEPPELDSLIEESERLFGEIAEPPQAPVIVTERPVQGPVTAAPRPGTSRPLGGAEVSWLSDYVAASEKTGPQTKLPFQPEYLRDPEHKDDEGDWQERALCAQTDPEAFFPEKGGSTREAKRICIVCPVRAECLEYAMNSEERFGIWGGLSERERRRLRRRAV